MRIRTFDIPYNLVNQFESFCIKVLIDSTLRLVYFYHHVSALMCKTMPYTSVSNEGESIISRRADDARLVNNILSIINICIIMFAHMILIMLFIFIASSSSFALQDDEAYLNVANRFVNAINDGSSVKLQEMFSGELKKEFTYENTEKLINAIKAKHGRILKIESTGIFIDWARFDLTSERGNCTLEITLGDGGSFLGFAFKDPLPKLFVPKRNTVPLRLPFRGDWTVLEGGMNIKVNYHFDTSDDARYAVDFAIKNSKGIGYKTTGIDNEDYYSYGKEILASSSGTVVVVIDGVPDNRPRSTNSVCASGNCIVIEHSKYEYSCYMHLKKYSAIVKEGQQIESGQLIGLCGNSGNSDGPHLHFQYMNSRVFQDATGIPPFFETVKISTDGKPKSRSSYSPLKNDIVSQ